MAEEDAEIEDDLHYYEAEMLQTTAQADRCKHDADKLMQQQQKETIKLSVYSETKGRKKLSTAKKRDQRAQIEAPSADRVVVLDENGVPLGHMQCRVCKKVIRHNKLTYPTLLEGTMPRRSSNPKFKNSSPKF